MKSWHERCLQPCLFLCSIRQPFLRPDRALLLRRRAQTPSRSAVAQTTPQCPTSRGRTLDGGEHGGRLAWVGQKTIRRSGTAKLEPAMLSPPSQLCAHGCIVPSSRSGLLYNVREWERERPSNAVTAAPSNCVNGLKGADVSAGRRGAQAYQGNRCACLRCVAARPRVEPALQRMRIPGAMLTHPLIF